MKLAKDILRFALKVSLIDAGRLVWLEYILSMGTVNLR